MNTADILKDTLVFLTAAVVSVPVSKKLGLGSLLGYLLAGVCIGPWVLGLIDKPEDLLHFSEFGVVMFLFLVGLELKPSRLWSLRRDILGTGLVQVLCTAALVAAGVFAFSRDLNFSLVMGMTLSLSSTAMALQAIQEKNLLSTPAGEKGFSILLFQDLAVIPMLAFIPLMAAESSSNSASAGMNLWSILLPILTIVALAAFGARVTRPVFRVIAASRVREIFTATSLLIVIGIAVLMDSLGMSMALGTFLAGVVLSESEYRHELEANIEPFKSLLLGLFFISVGMTLDPAALWNQPLLILGGVVGLMTLKFAVLFFLAKTSKTETRQALLLGCLLSQGSEFAFVLSGLASSAGVLPADDVTRLNLIVTLSMLLTPLVLLSYERLESRFSPLKSRQASADTDFSQLEESGVIIAGFGRVGQIVSRLLHSCHLSSTVLDHDPSHIEMIRRFGYKVYYGDATRLDLLEQAGIAHAKVFVCAIDDVEQALEATRIVRKHYPHVKVISRCRNLSHLFELIDLDVDHITRETFDAALEMGVESLRRLGFGHYQAQMVANKFRVLDRQGNRAIHRALANNEDVVSVANASRAQLEEQLKSENHLFVKNQDDEVWT